MNHTVHRRSAAEAFGAAGYLTNPFSEQQMLATVREHLGGVAARGGR